MMQLPPVQMPSFAAVGLSARFKFASSDGNVPMQSAVSIVLETGTSNALAKHCAVSKQMPLPVPSPPPKTSSGLKSGRSSESTAEAMQVPEMHVSSLGQVD